MGSCASAQKKPEHTIFFKLHKNPTQKISNFEVKIVTPSLLYSILAKHWNKKNTGNNTDTEIIDLRKSEEYSTLNLYTSYNVDLEYFSSNHRDVAKDLKILLDFKNVVCVGQDLVTFETEVADHVQALVKTLDDSNLKLLSFNILNSNLSTFMIEYPFFRSGTEQDWQGFSLPILLYDTRDVYDVTDPIVKHTRSINGEVVNINYLKIYVQNTSRFEGYFPKYLKEGLNVSTVIFTHTINQRDMETKIEGALTKKGSNSYEAKTIGYEFYCEDIEKNTAFFLGLFAKFFKEKRNFLIVHESAVTEKILGLFQTYLESKQRMEQHNVRKYIQERLPKYNSPTVNNDKDKKEKKSKKKKNKGSLNNSLQAQTRCDEITAYLKKLKAESNTQTVDEIYGVLSKMVDNLIKNPGDDKYKSVNSENAKLKVTVFKYTNSVKILELLGFMKDPNSTVYSNMGLEVNTMKMIRGDLELAYKNYSTSNEKK